MGTDYEALAEALRGIKQSVPADGRSARDSVLAPASCDISETFLTELRVRRERLKKLIGMLQEEARLDQPLDRGSRRVSRHICRGSAAPGRLPSR